MERELELMILSTVLCSVSAWAAAAGLHRPDEGRTSHARERRLWWRLWWPVVVAGFVFAFLVGWALQEADPTNERMSACWAVPAVMAGMAGLRAVARALRSAWAGRCGGHPIATVGLVRPRVVVSDRFRASVSPAELEAALAHERAHVRSCDPLRVWLAQVACDLQWPVPGAHERFNAWLTALEMRRDVEAVNTGASSLDLAAAIVGAARRGIGRGGPAAATLTPRPSDVEARVRALVHMETGVVPQERSRVLMRLPPLALGGAVLLTVLLGTRLGEDLIRALPGVGG